MDDKDNLDEELNFIEGGPAPFPTAIVDSSPAGASGVSDKAPVMEQGKPGKGEIGARARSGEMGDLLDEVLDGVSKGGDNEQKASAEREEEERISELEATRKELDGLLKLQPGEGGEDEEDRIASLTARLRELQGELSSREQVPIDRKGRKKGRIDSLADTLRDSMRADIRVFTRKLPAALKGSWLQGKAEKKIVNVQKEINEFMRSNGKSETPLGKMSKKAGSKGNISVRESDKDFYNRFMAQVQEAQDLGMSTSDGLEDAMQAYDRLSAHQEKNRGNEI